MTALHQDIAKLAYGLKIRRLMALWSVFILSSCATTSHQKDASSRIESFRAVTASGHWVKVRSSPPTWYPRGTPSDHPTDFRSGEWVIANDPEGSRFFIPLRVSGDVPRKMLVQEAMAARGPDKERSRAGDDSMSVLKMAGNVVLAPPLFIMNMVACGMSQGGYTPGKENFFPFDP